MVGGSIVRGRVGEDSFQLINTRNVFEEGSMFQMTVTTM